MESPGPATARIWSSVRVHRRCPGSTGRLAIHGLSSTLATVSRLIQIRGQWPAGFCPGWSIRVSCFAASAVTSFPPAHVLGYVTAPISGLLLSRLLAYFYSGFHKASPHSEKARPAYPNMNQQLRNVYPSGFHERRPVCPYPAGYRHGARQGNSAEAWGVLNPASARTRDGRLLLYPRAVAEGNFSRIEMAEVDWSAGAGRRTGGAAWRSYQKPATSTTSECTAVSRTHESR